MTKSTVKAIPDGMHSLTPVKVNKFASAVLKSFHCERRGNVGNIIDF